MQTGTSCPAEKDPGTWSTNASELLKKVQQRLYFLRVLSQRLLVSFYRCSVKSILTYCICVWYASCALAQRKSLQRVINMAQKIIGCPLLTLEELHSSHCFKQAQNIIGDISHPGHSLSVLLPSGRRYRSIRTRTERFRNNFYPIAVTMLKSVKIGG